MDLRIIPWKKMAIGASMLAAWAFSYGLYTGMVQLIHNRLHDNFHLKTGGLHFSCGGWITLEEGSLKRSGITMSFEVVEFGPRWLSLATSKPLWSLYVNRPHLTVATRDIQRQPMNTFSMGGFKRLSRWLNISFEYGDLLVLLPQHELKLENLSARTQPGGTFLLSAPLIHLSGTRGTWVGRNATVETRGRQWERLHVSFMRILSSTGVWLDAGGTLERVSSTVMTVDLFLRHEEEYAVFSGRINPEEDKYILDMHFSTKWKSLVDYLGEFRTLPPGMEKLDADVEGEARIVWDKGPIRTNAHLKMSKMTIAHRGLSGKPVRIPEMSFQLSGARREQGVFFHGKMAMGDPEFSFDAVWHPQTSLRIEGQSVVLPCQNWLQTGLPLLPSLTGMELSGTLGVQGALWFDLKDAEKFNAHGRFTGTGCKVVKDPVHANPHELLGPVEITLSDRFGRSTTRKMQPKSPGFVQMDVVPAHTKAAFLIAEDRRFFEHAGFDFPMLIRAVGYNLKHRGFFKGASTISQQLVKNIYLHSTRSIARKLEEAVLTWRMEQVVPKDRILELYLNIIEMGPNIRGITDGARMYFGREVGNLIPQESAHLALITPAPLFYYYQLRRSSVPDTWTRKTLDLVRQLHQQGIIAAEDLQTARERGLIIQDY